VRQAYFHLSSGLDEESVAPTHVHCSSSGAPPQPEADYGRRPASWLLLQGLRPRTPLTWQVKVAALKDSSGSPNHELSGGFGLIAISALVIRAPQAGPWGRA